MINEAMVKFKRKDREENKAKDQILSNVKLGAGHFAKSHFLILN